MKKKILAMITALAIAIAPLIPATPVVAAQDGKTEQTAWEVDFGSKIDGMITPERVRTWYKLELPTAGRIDLTGSTDAGSIVMYMYDDLSISVFTASPQKNYTTNKNEFSYNIHLAQGTYYFQIGTRYQTSTENKYDFTMAYTGSKESFPEKSGGTNNDFATANTISLGQTYNGYIAYNDYYDYYTFDFPSKGKAYVSLIGNIEGISYLVYNENKELLYSGDYEYKTPSDKTVSFTREDMLDAGKFYICIRVQRNSTLKYGPYSFTITNNDPSTPVKEAINSVKANNLYYKGKALMAELKVTDSKGNAVPSNGYSVSVSPSSIKNIGTYTVTIKGKGDYTGSKKTTFKVVPAKPSGKITPVSKGFKVVISKDGAGAANYQIQYSTTNKFTDGKTKSVNIKKGTKAKQLTTIGSKKTIYVRVRSYTKVNGKTYYSAWTTAKKITTK